MTKVSPTSPVTTQRKKIEYYLCFDCGKKTKEEDILADDRSFHCKRCLKKAGRL